MKVLKEIEDLIKQASDIYHPLLQEIRNHYGYDDVRARQFYLLDRRLFQTRAVLEVAQIAVACSSDPFIVENLK